MVIKLREEIRNLLFEGTVIPAYPLALNEDKSLDEISQRALTHYYIDSGVGGLAVAVHTTQFEIREPKFNLFEKVLRIAMEEVEKRRLEKPFIMIAGICGKTEQAVKEAELASSLGYDFGLLSMGGLQGLTEEELLCRVQEVAKVIPVFGFYLQPSAGGRILSYEFWKKFMEIEGVYAVKTAPFNRYQTLDVLRAVCHSSRRDEIAVYTGNDDNIVSDLLTVYETTVKGEKVNKAFSGGLLGHWAVGTREAVSLFERIKMARSEGHGYGELLTEGTKVTDANSAFFDVNNNFGGCIAGINEVLSRQGLIRGNWCLLAKEALGVGQKEEIDRVIHEYPELSDHAFIKENLKKWRALAMKPAGLK